MELTTKLKEIAGLQSEVWKLMRFHPFWKAIEAEFRKGNACVQIPEGKEFRGGEIGLEKVSRAAGGAWIDFSFTLYDEDDEESLRRDSIGVPDELLEKFTKKGFKAWLAERRAKAQQYARERARKILKQAGLKL